MTITLEGVCWEELPSLPGHAQHHANDLARHGQVAFRVEPASRPVVPPPSKRADPRAQSRMRTRLRSAKILTLQNAFLCECRIHDRSSDGFRLVLTRDLGLPARFGLFDDETGDVCCVDVVWRRGLTLGVRDRGRQASPPLKQSDRQTLRGRYYAVPDR